MKRRFVIFGFGWIDLEFPSDVTTKEIIERLKFVKLIKVGRYDCPNFYFRAGQHEIDMNTKFKDVPDVIIHFKSHWKSCGFDPRLKEEEISSKGDVK